MSTPPLPKSLTLSEQLVVGLVIGFLGFMVVMGAFEIADSFSHLESTVRDLAARRAGGEE